MTHPPTDPASEPASSTADADSQNAADLAGLPPSGGPRWPGGFGAPPPPLEGYRGRHLRSLSPARSKLTLMLGLAVAAVLLAGATIALSAARDHDTPPAAAPEASDSAEPRLLDSAPAESSPIAGATSGEPLSFEQFAADWQSEHGAAEFVDGWDYEDCADFAAGSTIVDLGCEYGFELAFEAENGDVRAGYVVMAMPDPGTAAEAVENFTDADLELQDASYVSGFEYGVWNHQDAAEYVVVTLVTAVEGVDTDLVDSYASDMQSDLWQDVRQA